MKPGRQDLFIPLAKELWINGPSYPTAMPVVTSGKIDLEGVKAAAELF